MFADGRAECPHKKKILGNLEISRKLPESLELKASSLPATTKPNFNICARDFKKTAVKHSKGKPTLLNYKSLSKIFCP